MSLRHPVGLSGVVLAALSLAVACERSKRDPITHGSAGRAPATGGSAGTGGTNDGGAGEEGGTAGLGGEPAGDTCGDERLDEGEDCDGSTSRTCADLGYESGTLGCARDCRFDTRNCTGTEHCSNGHDDDGDGDVDCGDSDCDEPCSSSCAAPEALADPTLVEASSEGHPDDLEVSCAVGAGSGSELVYAIEPTETGVLEVSVDGGGLFAIEIASSCGRADGVLACGLGSVTADVEQGEPLFVVVDRLDGVQGGPFTLRARSRAKDVCGDGYRDPGEGCDDGGLDAGDGCSATCNVEATETEPNDEPNEADALVRPFFAEVAPEGDVDWISVSVPSGPVTLTAATLNFGDGACAKHELDSFIELVAEDGTSVLASDDDGGEGLCARLVANDLAAGTYYLAVQASPFGATPTFPYRLAVEQSLETE